MKKLLAALFILGAASALANAEEQSVDPTFCLTNVCEASSSFDVTVKVPVKLTFDTPGVDLGLWCGDTDIHKTFYNHYEITGEKGTVVKVDFKNNGNLVFKNGVKMFNGKISTTEEKLNLDATTGKAKGGLEVKVEKLGPVQAALVLDANKIYTASATLVAAYDSAAF